MLFPGPARSCRSRNSSSYAPTGVGRHTCYSRVTYQDWLLSWLGPAQHPFPFPSLCWPPKAFCLFLSQLPCPVFLQGTAWQRDRGGSSSVSYPSPFLAPCSLFPFLPWPPLFLIWTPGWGLGLEHLFHPSETSPSLSKPSVDTLAPAFLCHLLAQAPSRWRQGRRRGQKTPKPTVLGGSFSLFPLCWLHLLWTQRPCRPPLSFPSL